MAVRNPCSKCGHTLSAPEELIGKKVSCPACGTENRLVGPEEMREMIRREAEEQVRRRLRERDRERLELIEQLTARRRASDHLDLRAARASLDRLFGYPDLLLLAAYLLPPVPMAAAGLLLALDTVPILLRVVGVGLAFAVALFLFVACKTLRELVRTVAELGDLQIRSYGQRERPGSAGSSGSRPADEKTG